MSFNPDKITDLITSFSPLFAYHLAFQLRSRGMGGKYSCLKYKGPLV